MIFRLTKSEDIDAILEYYEPLGLTWPPKRDKDGKNPYREDFIFRIKQAMKQDTVIVFVGYKFHPYSKDKYSIDFIELSKIKTLEEFQKEIEDLPF